MSLGGPESRIEPVSTMVSHPPLHISSPLDPVTSPTVTLSFDINKNIRKKKF